MTGHDPPEYPAAGLGVQGLDMHQQRLVAQALPLSIAGTAHEVRVAAGRADLQYPALHRDRPQVAVLLDEGVLQIDSLAKYAVAFPKMSRLIFARTSSARSRLISICSALTGLLSAPLNWPWLMRLDPVEQRLVNHAQRTRCRRNALAVVHQAHCLLLEFERIARP